MSQIVVKYRGYNIICDGRFAGIEYCDVVAPGADQPSYRAIVAQQKQIAGDHSFAIGEVLDSQCNYYAHIYYNGVAHTPKWILWNYCKENRVLPRNISSDVLIE